MKKYILPIAAMAAMMCACGESGFKVTGNIEGASDTTKLVLESSNSGRWFIIDSVKTTGNGNFSIEQPAPQFADVYRLRLGDKAIYFPIDSLDRIEITTSLAGFGTDYVLSGTDNAVKVMNIDKKAMELSALSAADYATKAEEWKRDLANQILSDPGSIVAYYIINKYIGDEPLFNPVNDFDFKIIGAVTNAFNSFHPNDPRTTYMVDRLRQGLAARRSATAPSDTMFIAEASLIDIKLQDKKGVMQDLQEVAKQGKVTLLNFTVYSAEWSPVCNKVLADVYRKYKAQGLEIFQVGIDTEEFQWRQSAVNLPWITVYDPLGVESRNLASYNVTQVPLTYIIDRKGEIVERVTDITDLDSKVAKYM